MATITDDVVYAILKICDNASKIRNRQLCKKTCFVIILFSHINPGYSHIAHDVVREMRKGVLHERLCRIDNTEYYCNVRHRMFATVDIQIFLLCSCGWTEYGEDIILVEDLLQDDYVIS